jgi:hypothetical protein
MLINLRASYSATTSMLLVQYTQLSVDASYSSVVFFLLCTCAEVIAEMITNCISIVIMIIIIVTAAVPIVAAPAAASARASLGPAVVSPVLRLVRLPAAAAAVAAVQVLLAAAAAACTVLCVELWGVSP